MVVAAAAAEAEVAAEAVVVAAAVVVVDWADSKPIQLNTLKLLTYLAS